MECRELGEKAGVGNDARYIVITGNPNVGKTAVFNGLTGLYGEVSNFPGTTVDVSYGRIGPDVIIDTPGVYGISSFTDEERLVRDLVLSADMVIDVVDTAHLERDLFLAQHIIDLGLPLIIALNMEDETGRYGLKINRDVLEERLGVPVVPTMAATGKGIKDLLRLLPEARIGRRDPVLRRRLGDMSRELGTSEAMALLLLEGDLPAAEELGLAPGKERMLLYKNRRRAVNETVKMASSGVPYKRSRLDKLGYILIRPATGFPVLILVMVIMYLVVGVFIAQTVVDFTQGTIMEGYYESFIKTTLAKYMDLNSPAGAILAGQFGILTMAVTYVIGLLTPLVIGFFLVLSLLEDSGYLPRIAILMDRLLSIVGLNGLAVIPLILGFGCVTAAVITTRLLATEREKKIAVFLLALAVPCSAQLALVTAIMARQGIEYFILYVLIVLTVITAAGTVLARFLPGAASPMLMNLPPLRVPVMKNVLIKAGMRSWHFLKEAFPLFIGGTLFLSLLKITGMLEAIQNSMDPVTVGWLNLPRETASAFIIGFIRREFGPAGIIDFPMSEIQRLVLMVTLTLFVPCITSVMMIFKERGWKEGTFIWISVLTLSFIIGGIVSRLFSLLAAVGGDSAPLLMIGLVLVFLLFVLAAGGGLKRNCSN